MCMYTADIHVRPEQFLVLLGLDARLVSAECVMADLSGGVVPGE